MERFKEIDILKGIGIILMIMGHQYYGICFDKWIHAFHMPMFFLISGFLYKKPDDLKKYFYKKNITLLVPYVSFAAFHFIIVCLKEVLGEKNIKGLILHVLHIFTINTEGLPICGAIWFLTALFFSTLIYAFIDVKVSNTIAKIFIIAILSMIGMVFPQFGNRMPLSLDISLVGLIFVFVGRMFKKIYTNFLVKKYAFFSIIGVICISTTIELNDLVNMRLGIYGNGFLFYVNAILMTLFLYLLCKFISNYNSCFLNEIAYIGKNSIVYLGFNQLILIFLNKISVENNWLNFLIKIMSLILCLGLLHCVTKIIMSCKLKMLIGK